jgi:hypothetical protein
MKLQKLELERHQPSLCRQQSFLQDHHDQNDRCSGEGNQKGACGILARSLMYGPNKHAEDDLSRFPSRFWFSEKRVYLEISEEPWFIVLQNWGGNN